MPLSGGEPAVVSAGHRQVTGVDQAGGVVVATWTDTTTAGELGRVDGGILRPLTAFGAQLRDLVPVVELDAEAPDGYPVHGWLAVPRAAGRTPCC